MKYAEQSEANCRAIFTHYNLPQLELAESRKDRCFFHYSAAFDKRLQELVDTGWFVWLICSYREVVGRYATEITMDWQIMEVDIDYFNLYPKQGLAYTMGHICEFFYNKLTWSKTNPFRVARGLRKRGISVEDVRISSS